MSRPSLYLFYGDDPLALRQAVDSLRDRLGESAEFNLQRFAAANLELGELAQACQSLPFLAERRLVIVDDAERLPGRAAFVESLHALLDDLAPSTALVFVAELDRTQRKAASRFEQRSPVFTWATAHPEASFVRRYSQPTGAAMTRWLSERATELDSQIEPQAAELLATLVDGDLRLADQELRKLSDYVKSGAPITAATVERLTPIYGQTDVFEVVDGLAAAGQSVGPAGAADALAKLHRLLQEQDVTYVFLMVARQFRLLLQARQALDQGNDPTHSLGVPAFVARKIVAQARQFSAPNLESFYRELISLEVAAKRGEADLSLDLLPLLASFSPAH